MQTTNYGINGSDVNELGQRLPPLQVYGKHEPWGSFTASALRGISDSTIRELVAEFHVKHGRFPTKYFSPKAVALKATSYNLPGLGLGLLDVFHDEGPERVE